MCMRKRTGVLFLMLYLMLLLALPVRAAGTDPVAVAVRTEANGSFLYDVSANEKITDLTGIQELPKGSGHYFYFQSATGRIYINQLFLEKGKYYYAGANGLLKKGWQTIGEKRYYFDKKTFAAYIGWKKISKKWYYFRANGSQIIGWHKGAKYVYYFDPAKNGARTTGWKTLSGKTYYFDSEGHRKTGLVTISKKKYYLNPKANGARKTGWVTVKGKTYYMSKKASTIGQAVTGWMKKSGAYYYFKSSGVMQKGWLNLNGRRYYLDPATGKRVTGKKTINGTTYYFGTAGYLTPTGAWSIRINKGTGVVTVYRGITPVKAMLCSVGNPTSLTPNGTFSLGVKHRWWTLFGGVYGQYTSQITGNILFHSVFYRVYGNNRTLYTNEYNKLGSPASHGCVRLNVAGAKYIYDNCPSGTKVTVFYGNSSNDPLGKPAHIWASGSYDPTDPYL